MDQHLFKTEKFKILLFALSTILILGCKKSPLDAPYDKIEGKYDWTQTNYREYALGSLKYKYASNSDFSAQVEFLENRIVKFYINETEIASSKFDVNSESSNDAGLEMELKINVKDGDLNFNKTLSVSLFGDDSLYLDDFPYNAYKSLDASNKSNLFIRN